MTLRSRNLLVLCFFLLLCVGLVVYGLLILNIDWRSPVFETMLAQGQSRYLNFSHPLNDQVVLVNVISPGISLLMAWLAALVFLRYFRKISSPQLFFLILFWLSMGTELVRVLNLFLLSTDATLNSQVLLARLGIMGRLTGSLVLFAASLYSAGIKIRQQEVMLGLAIIIAMTISWLVPIDADRVGQELLLVPARGFSLDALRIFIGMLTIGNYFKYAITTRDAREYLLIIPIAFLIIGQELLFLTTDWLGMTARRFISNYLWY